DGRAWRKSVNNRHITIGRCIAATGRWQINGAGAVTRNDATLREIRIWTTHHVTLVGILALTVQDGVHTGGRIVPDAFGDALIARHRASHRLALLAIRGWPTCSLSFDGLRIEQNHRCNAGHGPSFECHPDRHFALLVWFAPVSAKRYAHALINAEI